MSSLPGAKAKYYKIMPTDKWTIYWTNSLALGKFIETLSVQIHTCLFIGKTNMNVQKYVVGLFSFDFYSQTWIKNHSETQIVLRTEFIIFQSQKETVEISPINFVCS